jgi:ATP-dependent Clp protease ATP-binding subunit ClpA
MSTPTDSRRLGMGVVYLAANAEALRRGDRRVGTEHLVLAMLTDPDSPTARALGVDLATAREVLAALDRQALAAIGLSLPSGPSVLDTHEKDRVKLTPAARAVFTSMRAHATGRRLGAHHVLLGLLRLQAPDPAAVLLDRLGVDRSTIRRRLEDL